MQEQSHGSEGNIGSQSNAADDEDHDMTDVDNFDDLMNNVDDVGSVEDEVEEGSMRYPCGWDGVWEGGLHFTASNGG